MARPNRYVAPHPLAWPLPPEGLRAFFLVLLAEGQKEGKARGLKDLTKQELAWVKDTLATELARRADDARPEKVTA